MRIGVAVLLAAVVGTLVNAFAAALVVSPDKIALALVPGRYLVAIGLCALLPPLAAIASGWRFALLGAAVLTLGASLLAKLAFGAGASWTLVLSLNAVFAVAAVASYGLAVRGRTGRTAPIG